MLFHNNQPNVPATTGTNRAAEFTEALERYMTGYSEEAKRRSSRPVPGCGWRT